MWNIFKSLFGPKTDFRELMGNGALIVDVRTAIEFRSGHIDKSRNIPLDQIKGKVAELKKTGKPVITVCRSGARSSMAATILRSGGIDVYNGGAWDSLRSIIS